MKETRQSTRANNALSPGIQSSGNVPIPCPEPEIQTAVKIICERLGAMEYALSEIEEKFSPVMRPSNIETVRTHSHVCVTAMGMSLEAFENRLQDAIEKLEDLAARCAV